jgi:hypothetical protein
MNAQDLQIIVLVLFNFLIWLTERVVILSVLSATASVVGCIPQPSV